ERGGTYPLYASLYCNPTQPQPNCSTVNNNQCYAIWTSYPQCFPGASVSNPPAWQGSGCNNSVPTKLWQFAEPGACGYGPNVDMDEGAPGVNYGNYCFT